MNRVLISRIFGGLGNQLFIYSASRALALDNNCVLNLDIKSGFKNDLYKRKFRLCSFNIDCKLNGNLFVRARISKYKKKIYDNLNFKYNFLGSSFISMLNPYYLKEFNSIKVNKNKYIEGYWQSYRYFDHHKNFLRKQLCVPKDLNMETLEKGSELNSSN